MKKLIALCCAAVLFSLLAACGGTAVSTASSKADPASSLSADSTASASSGDSSAAVPASSSEPASSGSTSEEAESGNNLHPAELENANMHFITLSAENPDGSVIEKGLLVAHAPQDWEYDNYTTFFKDEKKIAEVLHLWPAADADSPFADFMTEPYTDSSVFPEGFGLISSEDFLLNNKPLRVLHMKTWPDDADAPSYPLYMFYAVEDYVVEIHFYPEQEDSTEEQKLFFSMLDTFDLHFSRDNVTDSDSSSESTDSSAQSNS